MSRLIIQNGSSPPIHGAEHSWSSMAINIIDMELDYKFVGFAAAIANSGSYELEFLFT